MSVAKMFDLESLDVLHECTVEVCKFPLCLNAKIPRQKQMPRRLTELYNKAPPGRVNTLDLGQFTF